MVKRTHPEIVLNWRRHNKLAAGSNPMHRRRGMLWPIVLTCFDMFKHLRGSGTVDKIKKYLCDVPRAVALTSAVNSHRSPN